MSLSEDVKYKIMIVDDHPVIREGIKNIFSSSDNYNVCCEAGDIKTTLKCVNKYSPDLIILDIALSDDENGIELIEKISMINSEIKIIVLSIYDDIFFAERAIRAGASGYLTKKNKSENILEAVKKVLDGGIYLDANASLMILNRLLRSGKKDQEYTVQMLSNREFEVFLLTGKGYKITEIAKRLDISVHTVESYRRNIKEKLNLDDSYHLLKYAIEWVIFNSN